MEGIKKITSSLRIPVIFGIYALIMAFPYIVEGLILGALTAAVTYFLLGDTFSRDIPGRIHVVCGALFASAQVYAMANVGQMDPFWYILSIFTLTAGNSYAAAFIEKHFRPIGRIKQRIAHFNRATRTVLFTALVILTVLAVYSCANTNLFVFPKTENALFGAKTSQMLGNATFTAFPVSHEMTMSTYGLAFLPLSLIAHLFALPLHFIFPATDYSYFFSFGIIITQILLLLACAVLLYDILADEFTPFVSASISMVFFGSYSSLMSALTAEKYVFSTFCLLLFVRYLKYRDRFRISLFSVAACSFAVNAAALPILLTAGKKKRKAQPRLRKTGVCVIFLLLISGSLARPYIPEGLFSFNLNIFPGIIRFFRFVYGIFLPNSYTTTGGVLSITPSDSFEAIVGAIIFALVILGGLMFRRSKPLMKISFYWVCVSAVLLGILGMGGDSMNIYAFCFGWAYICSIACCLSSIYKKNKFAAISVTAFIALFLTVYNIVKICGIINFGIANFPIA